MQIKEKNQLVLLVAFTAHVGAALTPFGTPQNLFIFSFYQLEVMPFIHVIAPFSFGLFALFLLLSFFLPITRKDRITEQKIHTDFLQGMLYLLTLTIVILAVLRICPWYSGFIALLSALLFDKNALKVDYPLLFTFLLFLGLANELKSVLAHYIEHPTHIFLLSSLLSQIISNVPSTLLLHQFTPEWEALLWGTNVGGFGTPVAALANLITYRIYASYEGKAKSTVFLAQMIFWGFVVYVAGTSLYLIAII
jgi:Na+/H+ antiporter NhaD/arsenite permease-like protein